MDASLQSFFKRYIWNNEARAVNLENPKQVISGWALDQILGGGTSSTGNNVTQNSLLALSAVYRAVSIKSGFFSSMPFQVFERKPQGRELADHPAAKLLNSRPNDKLSKAIFLDRAIHHYELWGNHYAKIERNGIGRVSSIKLLHPQQVEVLEGENSLFYRIKDLKGNTQDGLPISSEDMIHVPNMGDGAVGKSVIQYMREDASLMMDIRSYGSSFFGRGGKPAGLLIPKTMTTAQSRQEMKQSFQEAKKQGGEVAMPFGWEYKEISVPPSDAEWVASNDFSISVIARWFGVPTQKLGDSKVKYSNVEYMGIEFLQDTMAPIAAKFENEYTNKLFTLDSEKNLYAEFNLDAYLRADSVSKAEALSKRVQNAMITPNEARALDNRPSLDGGDELFIQGATIPLALQQQLYAQKTPQQRTSTKKKIIEAVKKGEDPQTIIESIIGNDGKGY